MPVMSSLPALTGDKDQSLQLALSRMLAAHDAAARMGDDDPSVTDVRRLAAQPAVYAPFPEAVDPRLEQVLRTRGINQLYSHQAESVAHVLGGRNVVIVTPT